MLNKETEMMWLIANTVSYSGDHTAEDTKNFLINHGFILYVTRSTYFQTQAYIVDKDFCMIHRDIVGRNYRKEYTKGTKLVGRIICDTFQLLEHWMV